MRKLVNDGPWIILLHLALLLGAGQEFSAGAATCTYSITPASRQHGPGPATNTVSVTTDTNCAWSAVSTNTWITISSPTNSTNSGTVTYTVAANPNPVWRTGVVMIATQPFTLSQQPVVCSYKLSTTNRTHGYAVATGSVSVTTSSGCSWSVLNTNGWITITSPLNNLGTGIVSYVLAANPTSSARTGTVAIADQVLILNQSGAPCTFAISPASRLHGFGSNTGLVTVTAFSGCSWTAASTNNWITFTSSTNGVGNGSVGYAVAYNPNPGGRTGVLSIATQPFTVKQQGNSCTYKLSTTSRTHGAGAATNSVGVTASSNLCAWTVLNTNGWITITSNTNGTGNGTVKYTVDANPSPTERTGLVMIAEQVLTLIQHGIICSYSISPGSRPHGYGAATGMVSVTTSSTCVWKVVNTNSWITILSATNATGSGSVIYAVSANPDIVARTGTVAIADQTLTLSQAAAPCAFAISPASVMDDYGSATGLVSVTTVSGCPWTVDNTNGWITINSGTNGAGSGNVRYAVAANLNPNLRTGLLSIAGLSFAVNQFGTNCAYILSTTNRTHGYGATTGLVAVTTGTQCSWTVVNTNDWITITSPTNETGSDNVTYSVDANPSFSDRMGVVLIAGQALTVTQRGFSCTYSISPANRAHGYAATTGAVSLATSSNVCAWTIVNTNDWITLTSPTNGTGSANVTYAVDANPSFNARTGLVMIADQVLTLSQAGFVCAYRLSPTTRTHGFGATNSSISVAASSNCNWTVSETDNWITITSSTNGAGNGIVSYAVGANFNSDSRTGLVMIADQLFTLTQKGVTNGFSFTATALQAGNQVKLTLAGGPAGVWQVQGSSNLVSWTPIIDLTNSTGRLEFTDTPPTNVTRRFYRAVQPQ